MELPIFWRHCGAAAFVYILAAVEDFFFREFVYILATPLGSSLCLCSGFYGGDLIIEEANFADILGIARERFKHVFLLRPTCLIAEFDFFCKSACVGDR